LTPDASGAPGGGPFTDDYLLYLMAHASAAVSDSFHAELAAEGISVTTWRIMGSLYPDQRLNVGALARKCLMKQPTLTRTLDRLVDQGIVARRHEEGDRRGVLVALTDRGRTLAADKIAKARQHESRLLDSYSEVEIRDLKRLLRDFLTRARRASADQPAGNE
jgi:DNA-binding MarR family transcriptional regulator